MYFNIHKTVGMPTMRDRTCEYVARKSEPESWNGDDSNDWYLDKRPHNGLGVVDWRCPHRSLEDQDYCIFHTDPTDLPDEANESKALLEALEQAGTSPFDHRNRPEHRGQFIGASFGAIELDMQTIAASGHDIRFDHAVFQGDGDDLCFERTEFVTQSKNPISFRNVTFTNKNKGKISFEDAIFRSEGEGDIIFSDATFRTHGDSNVNFRNATFQANNGEVFFENSTFRAGSDSNVNFRDATFKADHSRVYFGFATFITDGDGNVNFRYATCIADGGGVVFAYATFRTEHGTVVLSSATYQQTDDGTVSFWYASFITGIDGYITLAGTTFRTEDEDGIVFRDAIFHPKYYAEPDIKTPGTTHRGGIIILRGSTYEGAGTVSFENVRFNGPVWFDYTWVDSEVTLTFANSVFEGEFLLASGSGVSYITGHFNFSNAEFKGDLELVDRRRSVGDTEVGRNNNGVVAKFADKFDFSGVTFADGVNLSHIIFSDRCSFEGANLSGADFRGSALRGVSFERARLSDAELFDANLEGAHLYGALLGGARINRGTQFCPEFSHKPRDVIGNSQLGDGFRGFWRQLKTMVRRGRVPYCADDPRYADLALPSAPAPTETNIEKASEVYTTIEQVARANSLPGLASEAFLGRKDVQRREYRRDGRTTMRLTSLIPNIVARYGESPWRVLGTGGIIVLLWGMAYWTFDLIERTDGADPSLLESIYFSALTFTTLGYGDFQPQSSFGQFLAVSETALGVILLAILVFVFSRRATR